jgi:hypothetical protein
LKNGAKVVKFFVLEIVGGKKAQKCRPFVPTEHYAQMDYAKYCAATWLLVICRTMKMFCDC